MTVRDGFVQTWSEVLGDKGAFLLLFIAVLLYSFFYPLPYKHETVEQVAFLAVDLDRSPASRDLIRRVNAAPQLELQGVVDDIRVAQAAIWREEVVGVLVIPDGFNRRLAAGEQSPVQVSGHGGYLLTNSALLTETTAAAQAMGAELKVFRRQLEGLPPQQAIASPLALEVMPLYNPREGYGSYVVPAVLVMLLQQTLLVGMALIVGTWREEQRGPHGRRAYFGVFLAFALIAFLNALYCFGFVLWYQDYPRAGGLFSLLGFSAIFALACAAFGLALSLLWRRREQGLQLLLPTAIPLFFLSGYPWPAEALPPALDVLRWLAPSTSGIQGFIGLNQMGVAFGAVIRESLLLIGITLVSLAIVWRFCPRTPSRLDLPVQRPGQGASPPA
ncbi:ABC transporter permease [Alkalilimnicola ehrlichii]|nr:ABC transporter permease [Alkalilimnicola ehrlichii]